jgi:DNA-binding MarR family transcriptional regulator
MLKPGQTPGSKGHRRGPVDPRAPSGKARTTALRIVPPIHRATHQIGLYVAAMADPGVTQAEAHILDHLAVTGACTVGELHRAFSHRRSTLTSVLDRLAEKALVVRQASDDDRRTFVISLTAHGQVLAEQIHKNLQQVEASVVASTSDRDLKALERVLAALEQALAGATRDTAG